MVTLRIIRESKVGPCRLCLLELCYLYSNLRNIFPSRNQLDIPNVLLRQLLSSYTAALLRCPL
jgi:hypothetical protein